jgi:hypothetical protein
VSWAPKNRIRACHKAPVRAAEAPASAVDFCSAVVLPGAQQEAEDGIFSACRFSTLSTVRVLPYY